MADKQDLVQLTRSIIDSNRYADTEGTGGRLRECSGMSLDDEAFHHDRGLRST